MAMDKKELKDNWKNPNLLSSLRHAFNGIRHILNHHYNARLIFLFFIFAILLGFYLRISNLELFVLGVAMIVVFIAEVINTIIEDMTNLITREFHPQVKIIKDVAAGVVLVAILFSLVLGYCVFMKRIIIVWKNSGVRPEFLTSM